MNPRDLAYIIPSLLVGWFASCIFSDHLLAGTVAILILGYALVAFVSAYTTYTVSRPVAFDGKWVRVGTHDEVTVVGVVLWYHGAAVLVGLVLVVVFAAAVAVVKTLTGG